MLKELQKCNFYVKNSGKRYLTQYFVENVLKVIVTICAGGRHFGVSLIKQFHKPLSHLTFFGH